MSNDNDVSCMDLQLAGSLVEMHSQMILDKVKGDALLAFLIHKGIIDREEYETFYSKYVSDTLATKEMVETFKNLDNALKGYQDAYTLKTSDGFMSTEDTDRMVSEIEESLSHLNGYE